MRWYCLMVRCVPAFINLLPVGVGQSRPICDAYRLYSERNHMIVCPVIPGLGRAMLPC